MSPRACLETAKTATPPANAPTAARPADTEAAADAALVYPAKLTEQEHQDIATQVSTLPPEVAQQMLDVIEAKIKAAQIKTNPAAVFRGLVRKYRADPTSFDPSPGFHIAEQRRRAPARSQIPATYGSPSERRPSAVWQEQCEHLRDAVSAFDYGVYIAPLHGQEDHQALWLAAPNRIVAQWVNGHLPLIEGALRPHTALPVRVCIG